MGKHHNFFSTFFSQKVKPAHTPARDKLLKTCKVSIQTPKKKQSVKVQMVSFHIEQLKQKLSRNYNSRFDYFSFFFFFVY